MHTQQTSQKVRKKVFNWSEVHLYISNFLQNPYSNVELKIKGKLSGLRTYMIVLFIKWFHEFPILNLEEYLNQMNFELRIFETMC